MNMDEKLRVQGKLIFADGLKTGKFIKLIDASSRMIDKYKLSRTAYFAI